MSGLVTRCQRCATAFRVQRAQLAARGGKVRCGKCGTIFDGVSGLVEEGSEVLRLEPSPQLGLFDPGRRAAQSTPQGHAVDEDEPLAEFLVEPERTRPSVLVWGLLAMLAAAMLAGQVAYRYRTEIAALFPEARPALVAACMAVGCEVSLPRKPELMSIDSSDLQADPRRENVIVLNALLRNRAAFPQAYPSLELTLTDDADKPVVRRVLAPQDYLGPAQMQAMPAGLAPGGEAAVRVNFDAGRSRATGYRLYLFFPH